MAVVDYTPLAVPREGQRLLAAFADRRVPVTICTALPSWEVRENVEKAGIADKLAPPEKWLTGCMGQEFSEVTHLHRFAAMFGCTVAEILFCTAGFEYVKPACDAGATVVYYWDETVSLPEEAIRVKNIMQIFLP